MYVGYLSKVCYINLYMQNIDQTCEAMFGVNCVET